MTLEVSTDHVAFDNTEAVTLALRRNPPVSFADVSGVLRRGFDARRHVFDGIAVRSSDVIFNVPAVALGSEELRPGDSLTDGSGTAWQILAASRLTFNTRWRCLCRRQI